ncbi:MAG: hypothetical protein PHT91_02690 [Candidatus Nanoarchaeia archaeon]|nr:hypothetical protein [Candidatus Nanoarchaeia archaeon]
MKYIISNNNIIKKKSCINSKSALDKLLSDYCSDYSEIKSNELFEYYNNEWVKNCFYLKNLGLKIKLPEGLLMRYAKAVKEDDFIGGEVFTVHQDEGIGLEIRVPGLEEKIYYSTSVKFKDILFGFISAHEEAHAMQRSGNNLEMYRFAERVLGRKLKPEFEEELMEIDNAINSQSLFFTKLYNAWKNVKKHRREYVDGKSQYYHSILTQHENEADHIALIYLKKKGYDIETIEVIMNKISPGIIETHQSFLDELFEDNT